MVDDHSIRTHKWKLPEPDLEPQEEQEVQEPHIDIIWNVYQEKGEAKSLALRISLKLPLKP